MDELITMMSSLTNLKDKFKLNSQTKDSDP